MGQICPTLCPTDLGKSGKFSSGWVRGDFRGSNDRNFGKNPSVLPHTIPSSFKNTSTDEKGIFTGGG